MRKKCLIRKSCPEIKRAALGVGGFIGIGRICVCDNLWVDLVGRFGQEVTVGTRHCLKIPHSLGHLRLCEARTG